MTRRYVVLASGLLVTTLIVVAVVRHASTQAQAARELSYQASVRSYVARFQVGISREDVERQLRDGGVHFQQLSGGGLEEPTYSDLIKIGKEPTPWFCSEHNVYVALQFAAFDQSHPSDSKPSDVLKRVTLFKWLEGCL